MQFEVADVYALPFEDATFDAVFCHGLLEHLANPLAALGEMRRVLSPGGILGAVEADCDSLVLWPQDEWLNRYFVLLEALWKRNSGWSYPSDGGSDLHLGKRLRDLFHQVGFQNSIGSASVVCDGSQDATRRAGEWEAHYLEEAPLVEYVVEIGLATRADLASMATAWRAWGCHKGAFRSKIVCEAVGWV